jgi:hypothetical protein
MLALSPLAGVEIYRLIEKVNRAIEIFRSVEELSN